MNNSEIAKRIAWRLRDDEIFVWGTDLNKAADIIREELGKAERDAAADVQLVNGYINIDNHNERRHFKKLISDYAEKHAPKPEGIEGE